jgi:hypothetical protein
MAGEDGDADQRVLMGYDRTGCGSEFGGDCADRARSEVAVSSSAFIFLIAATHFRKKTRR